MKPELMKWSCGYRAEVTFGYPMYELRCVSQSVSTSRGAYVRYGVVVGDMRSKRSNNVATLQHLRETTSRRPLI